MKGSAKYQIHTLWLQSGIDKIGESKHAAKDIIRDLINAQGKAATWHDMGKQMGIHSFNTRDKYTQIWRDALAFAKAEFKVRDLERLESKHIEAYLESKVTNPDAQVKDNTFKLYSAACEKLETALNLYAEKNDTGRSYDFCGGIEAAKLMAKEVSLEKFSGSRAYHDPAKLIRHIGNEGYRLAAQMQYEGGARVDEIRIIQEVHTSAKVGEQLQGLKPDKITGDIKGYIKVQGKGGKIREIGIRQATYERLQQHIAAHGAFKIDADSYRSSLKEAAQASGQDYDKKGSHGLRWNFAQERLQEIQKHGYYHEQGQVVVSQEMGHERADITMHYIGLR